MSNTHNELRTVTWLARRAREIDAAAPEGAQPTLNERIAAVSSLLQKAWAKAEPDHGVTLHPVSYTATFNDMARAVIAAGVVAPDGAQGAVTPNHAACCAEGGGSISGCCCAKPDHVRIPSPAFEEWFGAIWAGSDKIPVPEWQSAGWNEYVAQRALALGAWEASWAAALATPPQPQDAARDREDAER